MLIVPLVEVKLPPLKLKEPLSVMLESPPAKLPPDWLKLELPMVKVWPEF